ncbi:MAG: hypothetical protein Q9220_003070 [cf. Caloplaca sp. 1 TL-2023]
MVKRGREDTENESPNKRLRSDIVDRFSVLSDELLLVLLSYLPIYDLTRCEQLSRRLKLLASDSQIWKAAYYERFVRPRAARIPGLRETSGVNKSLLYSSKLSKWLEDGHLVRRGGSTNWKRQYKLRHNWARGSCKKSETEISRRPSIPPVLVRLHDGIIVTADSTAGLRAWSTIGNESLIATMAWNLEAGQSSAPSSLAIDTSDSTTRDVRTSVGFSEGNFGVYYLDRRKRTFECEYVHNSSVNGTVSAIAFSSPYILTMTEARLLSLYTFPMTGADNPRIGKHGKPTLVSSLKSHTAWPPLSLAIRSMSTGSSASIAFAMPTYTAGWSVGLQELRLTPDGTMVASRLATPLNQTYVPLSKPSSHIQSSYPNIIESSTTITAPRSPSSSAKITSLSYTHPYLLASHSDNTLMLYMVNSSSHELSIGPGRLLCGHTSSVSGAHVGDRGKAVSVSAQGNDLRVWELEGGIVSSTSKRRAACGDRSVTVRPEKRPPDGRQSTRADIIMPNQETDDSLLPEASDDAIAVTALTKLAIAPSAALQLATTAARKVT